MKSKQIRALVESAVLVALGFVLSFIKVKMLPGGGSITLLSMLPILLIGYRNGLGWGLCSGVLYGMLQLLQAGGLYSPAQTGAAYATEFFLDYAVAFGALGLSGLPFLRKRPERILFAAPLCLFLRYLSHVVSGRVVWASVIDADKLVIFGKEITVWQYSFVQNATYMIPEIILTTLAVFILLQTAPRVLTRE